MPIPVPVATASNAIGPRVSLVSLLGSAVFLFLPPPAHSTSTLSLSALTDSPSPPSLFLHPPHSLIINPLALGRTSKRKLPTRKKGE